jgi:hypothetical protein
MARTITEIQQSIITAKNSDPTLADLSSTSNTAIWKLWTYVVAVCMWTLENLFDFHKQEVTNILATRKPHTLQWYVMKAQQFQYGGSLPDDSDTYATVSDDPAVVIIKYAAAVELVNMVRIKVAKQLGAILAPLSTDELTAFSAYMNRVKDAGVRLQLTSSSPDSLRLSLHVYYDPLVLSSTGARLDGADVSPVQKAVNAFLSTLPFNGIFVLNNLIAALQAVDGVVIGSVASAEANYGSTAYVPVAVEYVPDAGYLQLDETFFDTHVVYSPHAPL